MVRGPDQHKWEPGLRWAEASWPVGCVFFCPTPDNPKDTLRVGTWQLLTSGRLQLTGAAGQGPMLYVWRRTA